MSTEPATAPATDDSIGVETVERCVVRLADVIGHLNPKRWGKHHEIDRLKFELPRLPGMNMHTLTELVKHPEANEVITAKCNHCDTPIECRRIVAPFVACDACITKHTEDATLERHRRYWESICPERYRQTDLKFKDFPVEIWRSVKAAYKAEPGKSLFLYGPTGCCKTRVGMLVLKHALLADRKVGVLWPEKLRTLTSFDNSTFDHYAAYEVLLMDDALMTAGRESKLMDALKQLIDVRMRHNRPFIITSQIGTEEDLTDAKEFGEAKNTDKERIKALLRRLREECAVVPFAKAEPKEGESAF